MLCSVDSEKTLINIRNAKLKIMLKCNLLIKIKFLNYIKDSSDLQIKSIFEIRNSVRNNLNYINESIKT